MKYGPVEVDAVESIAESGVHFRENEPDVVTVRYHVERLDDVLNGVSMAVSLAFSRTFTTSCRPLAGVVTKSYTLA